ncbi:hypothetical protein BSNK01_18890 [Bacillaceae bacterium]
MLRKMPLKFQFVLMFALILLLSIIATIATYYAGYRIFIKLMEEQKIYPANYYERKIPEIEDSIRAKGAVLLDHGERQELEKIIPLEGISYQVMDVQGTPLYGTDEQRIIKNRDELYRKINSIFRAKGKYRKLIPLIDENGKILGGVALAYTLTLHYPDSLGKLWIKPFLIAILLSPFFYIILFTWLFAKRFAGHIGKPVNMLIEAAGKIKEKDLDFRLDYAADNAL